MLVPWTYLQGAGPRLPSDSSAENSYTAELARVSAHVSAPCPSGVVVQRVRPWPSCLDTAQGEDNDPVESRNCNTLFPYASMRTDHHACSPPTWMGTAHVLAAPCRVHTIARMLTDRTGEVALLLAAAPVESVDDAHRQTLRSRGGLLLTGCRRYVLIHEVDLRKERADRRLETEPPLESLSILERLYGPALQVPSNSLAPHPCTSDSSNLGWPQGMLPTDLTGILSLS